MFKHKYFVLVDAEGAEKFEVRFETFKEAEESLKDFYQALPVGDQHPFLYVKERN